MQFNKLLLNVLVLTDLLIIALVSYSDTVLCICFSMYLLAACTIVRTCRVGWCIADRVGAGSEARVAVLWIIRVAHKVAQNC